MSFLIQNVSYHSWGSSLNIKKWNFIPEDLTCFINLLYIENLNCNPNTTNEYYTLIWRSALNFLPFFTLSLIILKVIYFNKNRGHRLSVNNKFCSRRNLITKFNKRTQHLFFLLKAEN